MQELLGNKLADLPPRSRAEAAALLDACDAIPRRVAAMLDRKIVAMKTRHHGDYHLGQVLNAGSDFVIIDFEGEPARTLEERRRKRTPLRDVAGMLRSFHYAAHSARARHAELSGTDAARIEALAESWAAYIAHAFLDEWLATAVGASFIPADREARDALLGACLIEKAIYEVCYELNNRPDWVFIPIRGLMRLVEKRS